MNGGSTSFDNIERVRLGMTETELIAIMGKPDLTYHSPGGNNATSRAGLYTV
jgi:hypothetical protein